MLSDDSRKRVTEFREWVAQFEHAWSHLHVAALALRLNGKWVAVRYSVVLSDQARGPAPWGVPIVAEDLIFAFRTAVPLALLDTLIEAAAKGHLDRSLIPGLDRDLSLSLPVGSEPTQANSHSYVGIEHGMPGKAPRTQPRCELQLQSKSPSDSLAERWHHHGVLERAERRFIRLGHGPLRMLGARLGFWAEGNGHFNDIWNQQVTAEFIAPLPLRLIEVEHVRERDVVRAKVEIGPRIRRSDVSLTIRPEEHTSWFPARRIRSKKSPTMVDIVRRPPPGSAIVSLCMEPLGEVSARSVSVEPRLKTWPFLLAMTRLDRGHRLLRQGLSGESGGEFERAIGVFLAFVGYAPIWWGPDVGKKLPRPGDLQPGAAPDTLAFHEPHQDLLIVESTVGVVGSDKVTKLIGRTLPLRVRISMT
jgi:hypothetical protein